MHPNKNYQRKFRRLFFWVAEFQSKSLTVRKFHSKVISKQRRLTTKKSHSKGVTQQRSHVAKKSHSKEVTQHRSLTAKKSQNKDASQQRTLTAKKCQNYEDIIVVLMHKDDSTNRDWNVQTYDTKTMSLTFYVLGLLWSKTAFCGPKQRALPAFCSHGSGAEHQPLPFLVTRCHTRLLDWNCHIQAAEIDFWKLFAGDASLTYRCFWLQVQIGRLVFHFWLVRNALKLVLKAFA